MANVNVALKGQVNNLPNNSKGGGFTLLLAILAADLTAGVVNDVNVFTLPIPAKTRIGDVLIDLRTPFANSADATNNSTQVEVGDAESATQFMTQTELNLNGANVPMKGMTGAAKVYAAADTLKVVFTPLAGTALTALNQGEVWIYLKLVSDGEIG